MSYTAPQYVDTKEQAVLALASTIKGEAVTGGDGSVNRALDILADVLAEQDVQVPQTDAGAILALAQYVSGGGGGGGTAHSITCKIINDMQTGELLDMPDCVGMASIQDDGRWGSDNPYVAPDNPVEEAVGGTILYAHPYIADESTTYSAIGLGTPYADAFGGVALIGNEPSVGTFVMPDDDVIVLYVSGGGGD